MNTHEPVVLNRQAFDWARIALALANVFIVAWLLAGMWNAPGPPQCPPLPSWRVTAEAAHEELERLNHVGSPESRAAGQAILWMMGNPVHRPSSLPLRKGK